MRPQNSSGFYRIYCKMLVKTFAGIALLWQFNNKTDFFRDD
jgi:hypothetical protein